jgi:hypothetical protein
VKIGKPELAIAAVSGGPSDVQKSWTGTSG